MLKKQWTSANLMFSEFEKSEADLAKSLFDQNREMVDVDPTFREWPLGEYDELISKSHEEKTPLTKEGFYLRKISTKDNVPIGYVQIEVNAPKPGVFFIPMLSIVPEYQGKNVGREVVESVIDTVTQYAEFTHVALNVYAENMAAFRFWYQQGFTQIKGFFPEFELGKKYHCLLLEKAL
ncbi:spermidine acetyltransferase [Veronia nyctiphanis]|uniref:Spermidine acetyltransferase n=1 Tax=Veronia nyctiphanis TaxID=1278244 RepID=A0A4Q0YP56_9GAMM|nr:GNAT family N-acetyltransferase [Veronia nyctiphanis]RXJ72790.1 spermidine acetyltransferase [Veronia nyctiphanis]